mmetsp:Transcript_9379/g.22249  ORF Transcript_9379/g.22249 Transcript_9379/m.22249 type:complete len:177 (+) Transcript_9379:94-624(+)|eukprot:CAMPEP_0119471462 /NCGR_PEP_ID=MMETSP1344-20130328/3914_1 /TAXON_ID=236787 /ORGANISM="Florenciella parvula, Strain CCMP2471" /LENGTH=176 /DNA_ID=CAMNT_0007504245 /DNA_START=93 /DNA_END=623 /DNA_ORIENTATION=+
MPAYHSKFNSFEGEEFCSMAILPITTSVRGPAPPSPADEEDVIDETIKYFRANVFFRNFEVKGGGDRTLIYLTLYLGACLKELERVSSKTEAAKSLHQLAIKPFAIPGDSAWCLGGMCSPPKSMAEGEGLKAYLKQCREEVGLRVVELLYYADGSKNKWWQSFSKRKFMGKELKDR